MPEESPSLHFLRTAAAKHFVVVSYRSALPGQAQADAGYFHLSCFIIATEGVWYLVTAGHAIDELRKNAAQGIEVFETRLQDRLAGNAFPFGVPFHFNLDAWIVFNDDAQGFDYALYALDEITFRQLDTGGVVPIREIAWGSQPFDQYSPWLLVGVPKESYKTTSTLHNMSITIVPLLPTERPPNTEDGGPNVVYGQIKTQLDQGGATVEDVRGMSGGPIFGLNVDDKKIKYWVIGIQSFWFKGPRVVGFRPMFNFLQGFKAAIQQFRADAKTDTQNS